MKQPNILFLFADQVRPDALSCLGSAGETPNLDALAAGGYCFTNCYTPAPLCVPARVCLATGRFAHNTGAWNNTPFSISENARTWMQNVRDAGYSTALIGKTHLHSGKDLYAAEPLLHSYGYEYVNEVEGPHANCRSHNRMTNEWKSLGLFEAFCADMDTRKHAMVSPTPLPIDEYYDSYVGRNGNDWLKNYDGDKPWFCTISFPGPHEPWDTPAPYNTLYSPDSMTKPKPAPNNAAEDRPEGIFDKLSQKKSLKCTPEKAKELRADYAGGMKLIDDLIGEIIETVKARGELENTVIVFTSDHGELNGDCGIIHKRCYFRSVVNVPLIISTPESRKHPGVMLDTVVSMADIGPTLAELAGNPIDYEQNAVSLTPLFDGTSDSVRSCVLSECSNEIMYADTRYKLVINGEGKAYQLFDRETDPDEQLNLAGSPEYRELETELRLKLLEEVIKTGIRKPAIVQGLNPTNCKSDEKG